MNAWDAWDDPLAIALAPSTSNTRPGYSALPPNRGGLGGVFAHERADAWHNDYGRFAPICSMVLEDESQHLP